MAVGDRKDPYLGFNFLVEVDSMVVAGFNEVSGLQSETEVQEFREGGVNGFTHKRAGPIKYPANLVLKRGISDSGGLWSWYSDVAQGKIQRKTVSVVLLDGAAEERMRWDFQQAYPVKWLGASLRATASEIAVESVELAHEGLAPPMPSMGVSVGFEVNVGVSASLN